MNDTAIDIVRHRQAICSGDDIRTGMRGNMRTAVICACAFLTALVGLAALFPTGGAVMGSGEVQAHSLVKQISHPTGGTIAEILVRDGARVKRGDVLIRFDSQVSGANAQYTGMSVDQLLAVRARLEAEQASRPAIQFPAELVDSSDKSAKVAMEEQQRLFMLNREKNGGMRAQLSERIRQYEQEVIAHQRQSSAISQQVDLIAPERDGLRTLWDKKLVTIGRLNQLERTAVELTGQTASIGAQIAQIRARITEVREQMFSLDQTSRADAAAQLIAVNAQLNEQRARSVTARDMFDRSIVRAPYDGMVNKLAFNTIGTFVPPAQQIVEIVPVNDVMDVSARISPADIDQVREGQPARVRFSSFSSPSTPEIAGRLVYVSAERTHDERTGISYYSVRVSLSQAALRHEPGLQLRPGMPAEIFLSTGDRNMLSYITKPLRDQFARAFRQD